MRASGGTSRRVQSSPPGDRNGNHEIDLIVERDDRRFVAIEINLAGSVTDAGTGSGSSRWRRSDPDPGQDFVAVERVVFLVVVFLVAGFFVVRLRVVGPLARFSSSSSKPRMGVIDSGSSSLRSVALVSPSVT